MELDIQALRKGTGNEFMNQIQNVPKNLNERNLREFYETCLYLLQRDDLSRLTHSYVLQALISAISESQVNLEAFIEYDIPSRLPYKKFALQEKYLDVIYLLATYAPHGINRHVACMFGHLIGRFTRKCLTILSIFAERFQIVLDPWPMADLLFKYHDYFCQDEGCVNDYLSVIVYLNTNFPDFREARLKHSWQAIGEVIKKLDEKYLHQLEEYNNKVRSAGSSPRSKSKLPPPPKQNISILTNCYFALCQLYEASPIVTSYLDFPLIAKRHLTETPELQYPIISLLMRIPPNGCVPEVIKSLISLLRDENNKAAGVALASLAKNRTCASYLARDLYWLQGATNATTLNLNYKILSNILEKVQYRRYVANSCDQLVPFLNQLVDNSEDHQTGLLAASAIVRSLPIDVRVIFTLSRGGFLSKYYEESLSSSNNDVIQSTLGMTANLAQKGDAVEFNEDLCSFVDQSVRNERAPYNEEAKRAATYLAQHPRCSKEFKSLGLNEYFEENRNSDKYANEFLSNYIKSVGRPITEPLTPGRSPRSPSRSPFSSPLSSPKTNTTPKQNYANSYDDEEPIQRKSSSGNIPFPLQKPPTPNSRRPRE